MGRERFRGPLQGIPFGAKDLLAVKDLPTRWGAEPYAAQVFDYDATVVGKLDGAGAILIGKLAMVELAGGGGYSSPAASMTGPGLNPWDTTRWSGGSSSGSAAAVAAGLVPLAVGTDTGGSVRIPAALCGVVGIRPSFGLVPTGGVFPLAWSLDTVGVLAGDVAAAAAGWRVLTGGTGEPAPAVRLDGLRVGLVREAWFERLDDTVRERFETLVRRLGDAGAVLVPTPFPDAEELRLGYAVVQSAEAVAIHHERLVDAPELFDPEVLQRLRVAAEVPAYEYVRAVRRLAEDRAAAATRLDGVDVLLVPTVPVVAPPLGIRDADIGGGWTSPRDALLAHCAPWSVLGLPSMSVPVAAPVGRPDGLPVGAQLIGAPGADLRLLAIAEVIEELQTA
jgi:Asp-tRNA(Asn)/Glu-tRNA(Gln) amidotransferase A subunit family amidase